MAANFLNQGHWPAGEEPAINLKLKKVILEHYRQVFPCKPSLLLGEAKQMLNKGILLHVCSSNTAGERNRPHLPLRVNSPWATKVFFSLHFPFAPSLPSAATMLPSTHPRQCTRITIHSRMTAKTHEGSQRRSEFQEGFEVIVQWTTVSHKLRRATEKKKTRNISPSEWTNQRLTSLKTQPYPLS